jgi:hypothetical protein
VLPGMMLASDIYHDYFDVFGDLINDPMKKNESVGSCPQVTHLELCVFFDEFFKQR